METQPEQITLIVVPPTNVFCPQCGTDSDTDWNTIPKPRLLEIRQAEIEESGWHLTGDGTLFMQSGGVLFCPN